jgi:serine/threonine-protein kinase
MPDNLLKPIYGLRWGMDRDPSGGIDDTLAATASAEPKADAAPALLARYRTGAVIGRGGMGEVVTARDEQIGRSVAIKRLRVKGAQPEMVSRFLREARIQGRLDHPAIVPVHELCADDASGEPFFVMKQLSGVTLGDVITSEAKKFTRQELLRSFVDVCLAIEFAHTRGVVHRDLKPANIMLGDFGEVYVLDWGIARVAGEAASRASFTDIDTLDDNTPATVAGTVLGTPGYMSPEQVRGDADLDGRGDVYALGCILFEILAGKPLHPRGHAGLTSALAGIDGRPSRIAADTPPELDAICATATKAERDERFASARALGDAVRRFLDGDRDLAMRKQLAQTELERAHDALAKNANTDALRAAARALALDPKAREPAELVGRLMLEPPKETPPEVDVELGELENAEARGHAWRAGIATLGYVGFLPLMYAAGLRDPWYLGTLAGLAALSLVVTSMVSRQGRFGLTYVGLLANVGLVITLARVLSPLLIAPAVAAITSGLFALVPHINPWKIYAAFAGALLFAWVGELLGWLPQTTFVSGGGLVLHAATDHLDPTFTLIGMTLWLLAAPAFALVLCRALLVDRQRMQRSLQIQSWQLRQLVPRA